MSKKVCSLPSNPEEPINSKSLFSPVQAKILKFYDEVRSVAGVITSAQEFQAEVSKRFTTLAASVAYIPKLTNYSKLENWFASMLGWKSAVWDFAQLKYTEAGAIRELLLTNAKFAANSVELMATYKSIDDIRDIYFLLQRSLPDLPESKLQELIHDQVVAGQFPKLINIYDSPVAQHIVQTRYQQHIGRLQELGLSTQDITRLDQLASKISSNLDGARMTVAQYGMDITRLSNGGYFPIQATEYIKRILQEQGATAFGGKAYQFDTADFLSKSRASAVPMPLNLADSAKILNMSELELSFMLAEPGALGKYIRESLSDAEITKLVDNGTLFELPALSDELYSFFKDGLGLPVENLGEAIQLNPTRAIQDYNRNLRNAVENSSMLQTALEIGAKEGWVLDELEFKGLSAAEQKNFIKMDSNGVFQDTFRNTNLRDGIAQSYIHRTVADQLNSLWQVNVSFEKLGVLGQALRNVISATGFIKKSVLMNTGGLPYLQRVFGQNTIGVYHAAGMKGLSNLAPAITDVQRVWSKKSLDVLPNATLGKIGGEEWSLRKAYEAAFLSRASAFNAGLGEKVQRGAKEEWFGFWSKGHAEKFLRFSEYYHKTFGNPLTGKLWTGTDFAKDFLGKGFDAAYEQLASANQFMDYVSRWTLIRTAVANPSVAGRKSWDNFNEVLRWSDEYMGIQEDPGQIGRFVSALGIPFAGFMMQAPGSAFRHMLRNPYRYGRAMMLYSKAQNAEFTDGELKQWQKDSYNIFLGRTTDGQVYSINPGSVDYMLDTATWTRVQFERTQRAFGADAGSALDSIDARISKTTDFVKTFDEISDRFYFSKAIKAAIGINPFTNEKTSRVERTDTLLGFRMSQTTKTLLTEMLPILRGLDTLLPTSVVGSAPVLDPVSGMSKQEGISGWLGNVPTTGGTNRKSKPDMDNPTEKVAWFAENVLALNASLFSPEANLVRTYKDLEDRNGELRGAIANLNRTILTQPNRPDKEVLLEEQTRLKQLQGLVQYNQILVDIVARKRGYTNRQALEYVRRTLGQSGGYAEEALVEFIKQQQTEK